MVQLHSNSERFRGDASDRFRVQIISYIQTDRMFASFFFFFFQLDAYAIFSLPITSTIFVFRLIRALV
ncbi:hypothetical protein QVD17_28360 [Tagetes erecta]|uniref:Uncharacterized protein n=1 Tax=Tagetes erecta TaxID=13708 RepID=A0AAD8KCP9_TARER|nr:hypothetical protein QVD17_28360 [Tagetes erecta]